MKKAESKKSKKIGYRRLQQKYALLEDLMNYIPDVIYFKDKAGKLVMVNQAHARGLGLKPEEVAGKTDFDFFPKERAQAMAKDDAQVLETGKPIIDKIERATRPDGVDNYVSTTKIPRFNAKNEIIGLIGITRDITRRVRLEHLDKEKEKIAKKLQALKELNKLTSEFVSVVSHELRTPLAIIKEAVLLMSDGIAGPVNDKQSQLLNKANQSIEHLKTIIEELMDISKIESGKLKLHYSLVNLNDLLKDNMEFFRQRAEEKSVSLEYFFPREGINLFLDAEKVSRVLINLLNNAIRFTEASGKIKLEVRVFEGKVRVGVIDTGIGITRADLEKLFNKFVQVSGRPDFEKQGLGLGLSISKGIVKQHGGEIWAESKLGLGSKFYFTLPYSYKVMALEKQARERINFLIDKGIEGYLIHLIIINYPRIREAIQILPKILFQDLKLIIEGVMREFYRSGREKPEVFSVDTRNGEMSVIFPQLKEKVIIELCNLLKSELKEYFLKLKADSIFINLGFLAYLPQESGRSEELPAFLRIKKIFIGREVRRFKRFYYKLNVKVTHLEKIPYVSQTVDISRGGVCFIADQPFGTDAEVSITLVLKKNKKPLRLMGRVAWIKDIAEGKYKIGLEFIRLGPKDKQAIVKFIDSINAKTR